MNHQDFYTVEVASTKRSELVKAGLTNILSEKRMVQYGRKQYPRFTYTASVGFVEAFGGPVPANVATAEIAKKWQEKGFKTYVKYIAVD